MIVTTKRMQDELMQIYSLPKEKLLIIPNGIIVGKMRRGGCWSDQGEIWHSSPGTGGALLWQDEHPEGSGSPGGGHSPGA